MISGLTPCKMTIYGFPDNFTVSEALRVPPCLCLEHLFPNCVPGNPNSQELLLADMFICGGKDREGVEEVMVSTFRNHGVKLINKFELCKNSLSL